MSNAKPDSSGSSCKAQPTDDPKEGVRDLFFDPWLIARGNALSGLVGRTLSRLDLHERATRARMRARRDADRETHASLVETVVANLAYAIVDGRNCPVAVPLRNAGGTTRYDRRILRQIRRLLGHLRDLDFLVLTVSSEAHRLSTMRPSAWFERQVKKASIAFADFGHHQNEEVIVLTHSLRDYSNLSDRMGARREWIEYDDTAVTRRYRKEMLTINAALVEAQMGFATSGPELTIDTHKRRLKRFFSHTAATGNDEPTFNLNGRLFGGWWQNLERSLRRHIRIDGESVVDLDYASMFPRLAYVAAGQTPPEGDLYDIDGLAAYRDGVKRALNTLLFADQPRIRLPSEVKADLPSGWTVGRMRAAILEKHPALSSVLERGLGLTFMFQESQVLVSLLLRLLDKGIVALPMHDGVMVARSQAAVTRAAMEDAAWEILGVRLPVVAKEVA